MTSLLAAALAVLVQTNPCFHFLPDAAKRSQDVVQLKMVRSWLDKHIAGLTVAPGETHGISDDDKKITFVVVPRNGTSHAQSIYRIYFSADLPVDSSDHYYFRLSAGKNKVYVPMQARFLPQLHAVVGSDFPHGFTISLEPPSTYPSTYLKSLARISENDPNYQTYSHIFESAWPVREDEPIKLALRSTAQVAPPLHLVTLMHEGIRHFATIPDGSYLALADGGLSNVTTARSFDAFISTMSKLAERDHRLVQVVRDLRALLAQ